MIANVKNQRMKLNRKITKNGVEATTTTKVAEYPFFSTFLLLWVEYWKKKSYLSYTTHNKRRVLHHLCILGGYNSSSTSLQFHVKVSNDRILQYRKFSRIVIIIISIIVSIGVYRSCSGEMLRRKQKQKNEEEIFWYTAMLQTITFFSLFILV